MTDHPSEADMARAYAADTLTAPAPLPVVEAARQIEAAVDCLRQAVRALDRLDATLAPCYAEATTALHVATGRTAQVYRALLAIVPARVPVAGLMFPGVYTPDARD